LDPRPRPGEAIDVESARLTELTDEIRPARWIRS
jgi:hypothetical protein